MKKYQSSSAHALFKILSLVLPPEDAGLQLGGFDGSDRWRTVKKLGREVDSPWLIVDG